MKKKIISILVITLIFHLSIFTNIYASTKTEVRTEENLKISDKIKVTEKVKRAALATPKVNEEEKIYDFANLLTEEQENSLYYDILDFIYKQNLDMAVVTINDNNKASPRAYADDFYDYNYFGKGSTFDGLLLLIDMDNREVYITTTGQAMLIYSDSRIDNMLDYIAPKLTSKDYKGAVEKFIYYSNDYANKGVASGNKDYYVDDDGHMQKDNTTDFKENLKLAFVYGLIPTIIVMLVGIFMHKNVRKANKAGLYLDKNSVNITDRDDRFLRTNTTKVRIESSSGGSSSHRSSSGRSHGGGGRSF